jgi:hypothetical protein
MSWFVTFHFCPILQGGIELVQSSGAGLNKKCDVKYVDLIIYMDASLLVLVNKLNFIFIQPIDQS